MISTHLNGTEASPVCDKKNLISLTAFGNANLADILNSIWYDKCVLNQLKSI